MRESESSGVAQEGVLAAIVRSESVMSPIELGWRQSDSAFCTLALRMSPWIIGH